MDNIKKTKSMTCRFIEAKSQLEFECTFEDKTHFPLPLCVQWIEADRWVLLSDFEYHRDNGEIITAEAGFKTDFGSKPPIVWGWIGSPTDEAGPAYVIHDWLCVNATWGRAKTDRIFYEAMRDLKVSYLKRTTMYLAVRVWSFF